jgi:hypothetical protein
MLLYLPLDTTPLTHALISETVGILAVRLAIVVVVSPVEALTSRLRARASRASLLAPLAVGVVAIREPVVVIVTPVGALLARFSVSAPLLGARIASAVGVVAI